MNVLRWLGALWVDVFSGDSGLPADARRYCRDEGVEPTRLWRDEGRDRPAPRPLRFEVPEGSCPDLQDCSADAL